MRGWCRLVLLAVALVAARAGAQQAPGRKWQELNPADQQRAWENYERYRRLPADRQRFIEQRYRQFQALPPNERERLRQNYETYRDLPPAERHEFTEKYRRWKKQR